MKIICLLISVFAIVIATSVTALSRQVCIEIKDNQHLPKEIYSRLQGSKALLTGEMHGTNETPQYVEGMVNLWLDAGRKVLLGLEISGTEQPVIDSFISSGDFSIIKKSAFFNSKVKDGRNSLSMGNLIKSCYGKLNLKIVCLDIANRQKQNRDSMMAVCANNAVKSNPGWMLITLTGNIHNRLDSNNFGKTMGYWLHTLPRSVLKKDEIASLDVMYDKGTAWNCTTDCGVHEQSGYSYTIVEHPNLVKEKCKYDNFFEMTKDGVAFIYTKTVTASLPLNP